MPRLQVPSILLVILASASIAAGAPPTYPCHQVATPPVVDGEVRSDDVWRALPFVTGFSLLGDGFTVAKQTVARACWDGQALYLAFICEEPDAASMKFEVRDGGDAWLDDGIEIFLQPGGAGGKVYHLIVTGRGAKACGVGTPDFTKVTAATQIGADFYSLELAIPHEVVETEGSLGRKWRVNFCRNIFTTISGGDRFTTWAPSQRQFLEPESFGEMTLRGPGPDAGELASLDRRLNSGYRKDLLERIRGVAADGSEYAGTLKEAAKDPVFGRDARKLRRRWRRLERALSDANGFPTEVLRAAKLDATTLSDASYSVKYKYLIHKILEAN